MTSQTLSAIINLLTILISLFGTFILVRWLKFDDSNSRIIFLLYIVYWIPPLLCRDFTAIANVHFDLGDKGFLLWIPVIVFGFIGLFWRPLNDILTYRLKSRKLLIYISLLIQLITILPFMLYPCFATNIIQSIGCGVGASGIGLFTLMFHENQDKHKKFLTISMFALPPIIASFIVAAMESFVSSFVKDGHTNVEYIHTIWHIWLIALIFIVTSFILCFFVKERRETLYQDNKYKEPIVKKQGHWKMVLLCACAVCLTFVRWATAGPFAGLQQTYLINHFGLKNTAVWEGYIGISYSFGCLIGSASASIAILKSKTKNYQPIVVGVAILIWIVYLVTNAKVVGVHTFFWTQIINGIGFGLLWNIFMEIVLNKFYFKHNIITPIGAFNTSLSFGMCLGTLFTGLSKYLFFDFHGSQTVTWDDFLKNCFYSNMILIGVALLLGACFAGYFVLEKLFKERLLRTERKIATIGENEL